MGRAVLHLGCGNSPFPEEMYDAGYHVQTCVDVSPSVVASMESRNRARPQMRWLACDCTDLQGVLEDETFDVVVDKGTFDAITCHDQHALMVARFVKAARRRVLVSQPARARRRAQVAVPTPFRLEGERHAPGMPEGPPHHRVRVREEQFGRRALRRELACDARARRGA